MKKLILTSMIGFIVLTICTILLGIIRIEVILDYVENEILAKAILLPVNFLYIFCVSYTLVRYNRFFLTSKTAIWIGVIWAALALCLDFFVGYYLEARTISYLLGQFNILYGNTWTVVLLLIAVMPVFIKRIILK